MYYVVVRQVSLLSTINQSNLNCLTKMTTLRAEKLAALFHFCQTGDVDNVAKIMQNCKNDEVRDDNHVTHLHVAAANNQVKVLKYLLKLHSDVNAVSKFGWSALHQACYHGHNEAIKVLLEAGALLNQSTYFGATSWQLAVASGHISALK